jgi:hypothetical protein
MQRINAPQFRNDCYKFHAYETSYREGNARKEENKGGKQGKMKKIGRNGDVTRQRKKLLHPQMPAKILR